MAGCSRDDLQSALNLADARCKTSSSDDNTHLFWMPTTDLRKKVTATYDYTDEESHFLYEKVRFEPKTFVQRRRLNRNWVWGLSEGEYAQDATGEWRKVSDRTPANAVRRRLEAVRMVLYHLPEVVAADTVWVAEGEKAADAIRSLGFTATCAPGGAGKWRAEYSTSLKGKRVVICPDNDEQGGKHAEIVTASLRKIGIDCCTVRLPNLPAKGDAYDAIYGNGLTAEEFEELAALAWMRRDETETVEAFKEHAAEYRLTDGGNGERFANQHCGKVAWVPQHGLLVYRDGVFIEDDVVLMRYANETVQTIYNEASRVDEDVVRRKGFAEWAKRSDNPRSMKAMLEMAKFQPLLEVPVTKFDADPYQLCVKNGVVDLKTGDLLPHAPERRMRKMAPANFDLNARCPMWMAHLERIFDGDADLILFLQILFGYALTGLSVEQVFAIFWGGGANGKSVTLHLMEKAMGEYATAADAATFSRHPNSAARNDLARLYGARMVTTYERSGRQTLDEEVIKRLTGGDKITARFLYKEAFEYTPQFLIVMSTNNKPTVETADHAMKRRVMLVPFEVTIPEEEQDRLLEQKLEAELDGILSWGILGATMYCDAGLAIPARVSAATNQYRHEMDPMEDFAELLCADPTAITKGSDIRTMLTRWAEDEGIDPKHLPNARAWTSWLLAHGATEKVHRKDGSWYRGITMEGCSCEHSMDMGGA